MSKLDFARASCASKSTDNSHFFPDFDDNSDTTKDKYERAKSICSTCPIRMSCLQNALDQEEDYGVWGGVDETILRRARFVDVSGRPVKDRQSIICPNCQDESHENLYVIENIKTTADVGCYVCGLTWSVRKNLDCENPQW